MVLFRFRTYTAHCITETDVVGSDVLRKESALSWVNPVGAVSPRTSFEYAYVIVDE